MMRVCGQSVNRRREDESGGGWPWTRPRVTRLSVKQGGRKPLRIRGRTVECPGASPARSGKSEVKHLSREPKQGRELGALDPARWTDAVLLPSLAKMRSGWDIPAALVCGHGTDVAIRLLFFCVGCAFALCVETQRR